MDFQSLNLCQYKDILGKPNEGIRNQLRIFNISVVDVIGTIILGLILSKLFDLTNFNGILLAFLLSIIFHRLFCVDTTIIKWISSLNTTSEP